MAGDDRSRHRRHAADAIGRRSWLGRRRPRLQGASSSVGGDSVFWDTYWYGGGYGAITYGFVFYWLAQYIPGALIVIVAAGTIPVTFYLYIRDMWKIDDVWPAWGFALVMSLYLAHGQDPFVLALALTMGGLALLARRRPLWAALPVAVGIFSNPMGIVVVAPFMLTDFIVRRGARRRYVVFAAALAPAVVVRFGLGLAFSEPGSYLNETSQLMVFLGFALIGLALAGVNAVHPRRPFVVLFLVYAVVCVGSFVTPGSPLGNNIGRFFMVFGLPLLLLLRHTRLRRPFRYGELAIIPIVLFALLQFGTATSHYLNAVERPQTTRAYFAPALAAARDLYDPDYRFHVVALRRHWEALYFPEAGYPITRGWYRQADAIHNGIFYTPYDAAEYVPWLQSMGVQYVFSPVDGPLDPWSRREARLLESSPAFAFVEQTGAWRIYRLLEARPLLVPQPEVAGAGVGDVLSVGHQRIVFRVTPARHLLAEGHVVALLGARGRAGDGAPPARPVHGPAPRQGGHLYAALRGDAGQGARRRRRQARSLGAAGGPVGSAWTAAGYNPPMPRSRLAPEVFALPVDHLREGYYSDAYFNGAKRVLEAKDLHPRVTMQVFAEDRGRCARRHGRGARRAAALLGSLRGRGRGPRLEGRLGPTHRGGALRR